MKEGDPQESQTSPEPVDDEHRSAAAGIADRGDFRLVAHVNRCLILIIWGQRRKVTQMPESVGALTTEVLIT